MGRGKGFCICERVACLDICIPHPPAFMNNCPMNSYLIIARYRLHHRSTNWSVFSVWCDVRDYHPTNSVLVHQNSPNIVFPPTSFWKSTSYWKSNIILARQHIFRPTTCYHTIPLKITTLRCYQEIHCTIVFIILSRNTIFPLPSWWQSFPLQHYCYILSSWTSL